MTEVIEGTPPQASAPKAPAVESTTATEAAPSEATAAEAATAEDIHLESTIANIDKILLDMAAEETAATPSATDVEEILKVMTESLPVKLSPLGPHLTKLF